MAVSFLQNASDALKKKSYGTTTGKIFELAAILGWVCLSIFYSINDQMAGQLAEERRVVLGMQCCHRHVFEITGYFAG